ncbi:MAG: hypothetical protein WKF67_10575 [Rubrobacteraceae bacterium]
MRETKGPRRRAGGPLLQPYFNPASMPALRAVFGEGADTAVTVSKAGLKGLARAEFPSLMAELEEAGAVEVTHLESLREVGESRAGREQDPPTGSPVRGHLGWPHCG